MKLAQSTIPFPVGQSPRKEKVADWAELVALDTRAAFKRGDMKSALSREDVSDADSLEESAWRELVERDRICRSVWPFRLDDAVLTPRTPKGISWRFYRFLAMLGLGHGVTADDRRLFEEAFAGLMVAMTGAPGIRVGHPPTADQEPSFADRFKDFLVGAGASNEEHGKDALPTDKDLGLDAAAAEKLFADNRGGATLHYWAQCSTGYNWEEKLSDLDFEVWRPHFAWSVRPVKLMATPLVLVMPEPKWHRVVRKGGIVVDRPRLLQLSRQVPLGNETLKTMSRRCRENLTL